MSELIGHEQILKHLLRTYQSGRLGHALLFVGPKSVGKRTAANKFLKEALDAVEPWPDLFVVRRELNEKEEIKRQISIEQIRTMRDFFGLRSAGGGLKIGLIDEAETLSLEAANALLKILEEPSGPTLFILIATNEKILPPTVVSRCRVIRFEPVPETIMIERFGQELAEEAHGSPGLAIELGRDSVKFDRIKKTRDDWRRLQTASLSDRLSFANAALENSDLNELLTVFEDTARRDLITQPTPEKAGQTRRLFGIHQALAGNVNHALALERLLIEF